MARFLVDIAHITPEIERILEQLRALPGVKISPQQEQCAWDKAFADGAVGVDDFFDELDVRIDKWSEARS
jgi:hypothetical protein